MRHYFKNLFKKDIPIDNTHQLPQHIAIIMDGNGRWAKSKGLPRTAGHRAGAEALRRIIEECIRLGIPYLTAYAFSTENWKRPRDEVNALMNLLVEYINKELPALNKHGIKFVMLGRKEQLPEETRRGIEKAMEQTQYNSKLSLQLAINYGGRRELVDAICALCQHAQERKIDITAIDEEMIARYLYTAGIPDPDLIIRPSGELRLSNFLLWQSAYSEFWITDVNWPDFNEEHLKKAIADFQQRNRRYGAI